MRTWHWQLPGWRDDDLTLAWPAWLQSCRGLRGNPAWSGVCQATLQLPALPESGEIRAFLEQQFQPWQISQSEGGSEGLVTGYYEPLLRGSRSRSSRYRHPLYGPPDDMLVVDLASLYPELRNLRLRGRLQGNKVVPYWSRAEIVVGVSDARGALEAYELLLERASESRQALLTRLAALLSAHIGKVQACRRLSQKGLGPREAAAQLGMHPYAAEKAFAQARNFSEAELRRAIVRLAGLDRALKGGSRLPGELEFERTLIALTEAPN